MIELMGAGVRKAWHIADLDSVGSKFVKTVVYNKLQKMP